MRAAAKHIIAIILLATVLSSCNKETGGPDITTPDSFSAIFEQFWTSMNTRYVFWDIDKTNWETMHSKYAPVFASLNLNSAEDVKKSVNYFREMTASLIDGHFHIKFLPAVLKDSSVNPSLDKKKQSPDFHQRVSYATLARMHYLEPGSWVEGRDNTTDPSRPIYAITGMLNGNILYFNCNSFFLYDSWNAKQANGVRTVLEAFFSKLEQTPSTIKGLIVDVRGNNGGNIADLNFFLGRITNKTVQFGSTRYKNGAGRLDFTPWVTSNITPVQGSRGVSFPVIALADIYSASLAESITLGIRQLPGGLFMGERTWGANGPYAFNEYLYNAGPFKIPGFMEVQTSSAAFKLIDGSFAEGQGITPDVAVPFNRTAVEQGYDVALEAARERLSNP